MNSDRSFFNELSKSFEPQLEFIREQIFLLNESLIEYCSPLQLMFITAMVTATISYLYGFLFDRDENLQTRIKQTIFRLARRIPAVQRKIAKESERTVKSACREIAKSVEGHRFTQSLPENGLSKTQLFDRLEEYRKLGRVDCQSGQVSGCVYKLSKTEMKEIYTRVFDYFGDSNPLHADVFPDIRTMEAEVVRCVATMFHGDGRVCGTMTSGGTESLLMACKTYRDLAYSKGITKPEIVMPITAHPGFNKACAYFKIKLVRIPIDSQTCEVDLKKMRRAINANTCMIVASAPNFPHGIIDPVEELSKIAVEYDVPLHVDACLGGFLIAFMDQAGFPLKPFDFRLPGVMSISCDTHKYGFAPKGTSVILYRNNELRSYQFYAVSDWPGGIYGSPTVAGSRSGYLIACCWSTMMYYGLDGYVRETQKIIEVARAIAKGWSQIEGLYLLHQPDVSIVAIGSKKFNIYYLFDGLHSKGWHLIGLQNPPGLHIAVTQIHTQPGLVDKLIKDTKECVADILKSDRKDDTKTAVIYGTNQKVPDKSIVCDMAKLYIGSWYETDLNT